MAAFKRNLKIDQGATFRCIVAWKAGTPPLPVDLTGCTARAQVRPTVDSPAVLLDMSTTNGRILLDAVNGRLLIDLTAEVTTLLTFEEAVYDLEVVFADGSVRRLMAGSVKVSPEVTRDG